MRKSWKTGRFWLDYAAWKSCAFDNIFWKYLDYRFFGSRKTRLNRIRLNRKTLVRRSTWLNRISGRLEYIL
ncbi:hypothetical protein B0O99DRAFT_645466 [Bisporella sp. PMI_857]|nr:hypothetical protein B0O99DRAFT_645466 [Bisporella sp. PMI_857]